MRRVFFWTLCLVNLVDRVYVVSILFWFMNQFNKIENSEVFNRDATRLTMMSRIDNLISGKGNSRHDRFGDTTGMSPSKHIIY